MANEWLRLWHDMPTDPKWRTIARVSSQPIGNVIALYVHLLVEASKSPQRGSVEAANYEDLASALDIDTEAAQAIVEAMQGRVIVDGQLKGWERRQPLREEGSQGARGSPSTNYIYYVATTGGDVVKIGISKNPWARMSDLQTGSDAKFEMLACIKTSVRSDSEMHSMFAATRRKGEWFGRSAALNSLISRIKSKEIESYEDAIAYLKSIPAEDYEQPTVGKVATVATTKDKDKDKEESNTPQTPHGGSPVGFDDFWTLYPRHTAKQNAVKAWLKVPVSLHPTILAAVKAQAASPGWTKDGGQFIPHAASWINGKRWEDEAGAVTTSAKRNTPEYAKAHAGAAWWADAGFDDVWNAMSAGCYHDTAHRYANGRRIEEPA